MIYNKTIKKKEITCTFGACHPYIFSDVELSKNIMTWAH
jgi:hypothetical protein